jgi:DNA-binding XRE family transcriptional regulator
MLSAFNGISWHVLLCPCYRQLKRGTLAEADETPEATPVPDTLQGSPTVLRMILGRQLQALRERAGLSYQQAADAIYASEWTLRRIEAGKGALKPLNIKSLLVTYGVTDVREIDAFLGLARDAARPGWWHSYGDVLREVLKEH